MQIDEEIRKAIVSMESCSCVTLISRSFIVDGGGEIFSETHGNLAYFLAKTDGNHSDSVKNAIIFFPPRCFSKTFQNSQKREQRPLTQITFNNRQVNI